MIKRLFIDHPNSVGETYVEHMGEALSFSAAMLGGGLACLAHAFIPCLFTKTGSTQIAKLHERMVINRIRKPLRGSAAAVGAAREHPGG